MKQSIHVWVTCAAANAKLMQTASTLGLTLLSTPGPEEKATYARLAKLHGAAFDGAYEKAMIMDRHKDIADFHKEVASGKTPPIKQFAASTLPPLKSHLQMAMQMSSGGKMSAMHGAKM